MNKENIKELKEFYKETISRTKKYYPWDADKIAFYHTIMYASLRFPKTQIKTIWEIMQMIEKGKGE